MTHIKVINGYLYVHLIPCFHLLPSWFHNPNEGIWLESLLNGIKQKLAPTFQKDNNDRKGKKQAYVDVYNFP